MLSLLAMLAGSRDGSLKCLGFLLAILVTGRWLADLQFWEFPRLADLG